MSDNPIVRLSSAEFDRRLVESAVWYDGQAMRFADEASAAAQQAAEIRRRLIHFRSTGHRDIEP